MIPIKEVGRQSCNLHASWAWGFSSGHKLPELSDTMDDLRQTGLGARNEGYWIDKTHHPSILCGAQIAVDYNCTQQMIHRTNKRQQPMDTTENHLFHSKTEKDASEASTRPPGPKYENSSSLLLLLLASWLAGWVPGLLHGWLGSWLQFRQHQEKLPNWRYMIQELPPSPVQLKATAKATQRMGFCPFRAKATCCMPKWKKTLEGS